MKRVKQKDLNGCGMACVAMLTGEPYSAVCVKYFEKKRGRGTYTGTKDLKRALRRAGLLSGDDLIKLKDGETCCAVVKMDAILKVRPRNRTTGSWHWVVWDAEKRGYIDPREKPYKNLTVYAYLPVYRR